MNRLQTMELRDLVAGKIVTKLETRTVVNIFFDLFGFKRNFELNESMELTAYTLAILKGIEDDILIKIAQRELDMDTTQFTDKITPKGGEITASKKIDLVKILLAEVIKQMKSPDKIKHFIDYAATGGYRGGDDKKPLNDFMLIRLANTEINELFRVAQHDLEMDITQFTDIIVPKGNKMKIVKKIELGERLGAEIAKKLKSSDKISDFFEELGIFVRKNSDNIPLDTYAINILRGKSEEVYIKIAKEELNMNIDDLLN